MPSSSQSGTTSFSGPRHSIEYSFCTAVTGKSGMSAAKRLQSHLGQTPVQDLAFAHQVLDSSSDIFDRHLWVDPVLVEKVNSVRLQALQHAFDCEFDVIRAADESRPPLAGLQDPHPSQTSM